MVGRARRFRVDRTEPSEYRTTMSIHSSLKSSSTGAGQRNVWTRVERIAALQKAGRWKQGDEVEGLPKVRTAFKMKAKKKADAPAAEEKK